MSNENAEALKDQIQNGTVKPKSQEELRQETFQRNAKAFGETLVDMVMNSDLLYEEVEYLPEVFRMELQIRIGKSKIIAEQTKKFDAVKAEYADRPIKEFNELAEDAK